MDKRDIALNLLKGAVTPPLGPYGDPSFSPVMDPEVRKRLQLDFENRKPGNEAGEVAQAVPEGTPPQPMGLASAGNPFLSKYSVSGSYLTPEDRARRQQSEIQFKKLLSEQEAGLDQQAQLVSDLKNNSRNDWVVPAAQFLDQTYGGNSVKAARDWSGMSPEERTQAIQKIEQAMNAQRSTMAGQVKSMIDSNNQLRMAEAADKNNRFREGQDMRLNMQFNRDVQNTNKVAWDTLQQVAPIEAALQPDGNGMVDIARITQALSQASRLMGERGVLTDQDIERVHKMTISQQIAGIEGYMSDHPSQPVPASIVAPLRAAIEDGKRSMQMLSTKKLEALKNAYVNGYGMRPEVGEIVVNQVYKPQFEQGFATPQKPTIPSGPLMSREEFLKQYKGR